MPRRKTNQTKHNREVEKLARSYQQRGYDVEADISGYPRPKAIGGSRPDLIAKKNGHETVVEVETGDSIDLARDRKQRQAFKRWRSRKKSSRHFVRKVTE